MTVAEGDFGGTFTSSYANDVSCDSDKGAKSNVITYDFTANYGDEVTCTFTNTRKPSSIHVTKAPNPSVIDEPGRSR